MYFHGIIRQQVPNKSFFLYISPAQEVRTISRISEYFFQTPFRIVLNPVRNSLIHVVD